MKKSIGLLMLIMVCNLFFSASVFGMEEGKKVFLGEKQIEKLRGYGMSEEDLANLSQEKVIEFMRQLSKPPSTEKYAPPQGYSKGEIERYYEIIKEKELSEHQMKILGNLGFMLEDINKMAKDELIKVLSVYETDEFGLKALHAYNKPIPYFGSEPGEITYFDTKVHISDSSIQSYCDRAMTFAEYVFSRTYNYSSTKAGQNIRFSYFLYGEAYPGVHEGLDVCDMLSSTRSIRSATPGEIVGPVGGTYGQVRVWDDYLNETIVYLHMYNIPQSILNGTKKSVTVGENIGTQGKAGASSYHLHVQALDGKYTKSTIPPGGDDILESRIPYYYINFWI